MNPISGDNRRHTLEERFPPPWLVLQILWERIPCRAGLEHHPIDGGDAARVGPTGERTDAGCNLGLVLAGFGAGSAVSTHLNQCVRSQVEKHDDIVPIDVNHIEQVYEPRDSLLAAAAVSGE